MSAFCGRSKLRPYGVLWMWGRQPTGLPRRWT